MKPKFIWENYPKPKCVILCAGKGARIGSSGPKTLAKVKHKKLLSYIVDYWKDYTDQFVFVVDYQKEKIIDFVKTLCIKADFVQGDAKVGIGDELNFVKPYVGKKFILVLGDCLCQGKFNFPKDFNQGIGVWLTDNQTDIRRSYSVETKNGLVKTVVEKPETLPNNLCGLGFYFFDKKIFDYIKKTPLSVRTGKLEITDIIQTMIEARQPIVPIFFQGAYININYPDDLNRAKKIL